jgi:hypothetical protein
MTRARLFLWTAAMVVAAAIVPRGAELLGLDLAGRIWNALRLTSPLMVPAGLLIAGGLAGAIIGSLQWALLPRVGPRFIGIAALAGAAVATSYGLYAPLVLPAAPIAGALAGMAQARLLPGGAPRWPRAQALAAAWVAIALMLPFPAWASAAFLVGAALLSTWGIR